MAGSARMWTEALYEDAVRELEGEIMWVSSSSVLSVGVEGRAGTTIVVPV